MIEGVHVTRLKQLADERGKVMHMLRRDSEVYRDFGEIYFSLVRPQAVKAWHLHTQLTMNIAVPHGAIRFVMFDDREPSATRGEVQTVEMSPDNYVLVTVPPGVWNGFMGLGSETAIVANCATLPHDPDEIERRAPDDPAIPYEWAVPA